MNTEYMNADNAADDFFSNMTEDDIRAAAAISPKDLLLYHFGTGRTIRNEYNMWDEDNPFTDASDPDGFYHPDQYSFLVMEKIVEKCKDWVNENEFGKK